MTMTPAEADTVLSVGFASRVPGPGRPAGESVTPHALLSNALVSTAGPGGRRVAVAGPDNCRARAASAPMTPVGRSTVFPRAVTGSDVLIETVRTKPGRRTRMGSR
ncbi:thioesterase [Streptomyces sp. NPDC020898]|uniref:thioesterase n=1 Tax=Streptomyces sp. NPDC020898 TaxID=3365101 RepID=UPI00379F48DD